MQQGLPQYNNIHHRIFIGIETILHYNHVKSCKEVYQLCSMDVCVLVYSYEVIIN